MHLHSCALDGVYVPGTIFCPVETSGDGRVSFYSRVQMYLFKARQAAQAEYERAPQENGVTREQVAAHLDANPKFRSPFYKAKHVYCGNDADVVAAVAPYITKTRAERARGRSPHEPSAIERRTRAVALVLPQPMRGGHWSIGNYGRFMLIDSKLR